ncbi:Fic family protein [Myxosarcina sp. GI1]|uniref:Fic family protein n=1 Tax=Myxosarcina sp. GI1 TaxID=1541065 RepID=UPI00056735EF|nr:death-on-curing protein [Myxosarcina sp. GI1]
MRILYFNSWHAVELHDWIIDNSGGVRGINNLDCLENLLQQIQNDDKYAKFHHKLTHLVFAIAKLKVFADTNKRLSIALGCYFMELNGYDYAVQKFATEMENIAVWLAAGKIKKELLEEITESLIYEEEYSEELKLKLTIAIA